MTPAPWLSIAGKSARSSRTAGNRFRSSARCHSSSSRTAKPPAGAEEPDTVVDDIDAAEPIANRVGDTCTAFGGGQVRRHKQGLSGKIHGPRAGGGEDRRTRLEQPHG